MSDFVKLLVEKTACHDDGVCSKNCTYLQAQYGGGYECELFYERVDDRQRLPDCVAAEQRGKAFDHVEPES